MFSNSEFIVRNFEVIRVFFDVKSVEYCQLIQTKNELKSQKNTTLRLSNRNNRSIPIFNADERAHNCIYVSSNSNDWQPQTSVANCDQSGNDIHVIIFIKPTGVVAFNSTGLLHIVGIPYISINEIPHIIRFS